MSGSLPDWVLPAAFVVVLFGVLFSVASRNTRKQQARLLARRPNPTRGHFFEQMLPGVSEAATEFLWETALQYLEPMATPHPDDDLVKDLWIDDDEWDMYWPSEFAERQGFSDKNYPEWPKDWPVTFRNYGRWLDLGLASKVQS